MHLGDSRKLSMDYKVLWRDFARRVSAVDLDQAAVSHRTNFVI
jgi:hypothetical protein